jgi:hypothetical protein
MLRMRDVVITDRLRLRELELDDCDALLEVLGDSVAMRYYPAPFDRDGVAAWIEWPRLSYRENGFGLWAVIRRSDGRFLGDCGPMLQPVEDQLIPEIGYHIVPPEQGREEFGRRRHREQHRSDDASVVDSVEIRRQNAAQRLADVALAALADLGWVYQEGCSRRRSLTRCSIPRAGRRCGTQSEPTRTTAWARWPSS